MAGLLARRTLLFAPTPHPMLTLTPSPTRRTRTLALTNAAAGAAPTRKLVLYSKKGCCLCDGLKEKLHTAFIIGGQDSISDVQLEVRDITANPDWEKAYQYEIPVLARVLADGSEETLPRISPRLTAEQIQKKLAALLG